MSQSRQEPSYLLREVFVPGGMPSITYQARKQLDLEGTLENYLNRLSKFIAIAGPTKSGKTVLARKVIPPEQSIWIEGAHISSMDAFWDVLLAKLGIASPAGVTNTKSFDETTEDEIDISVRPAGMGGGSRSKDSIRKTTTTAISQVVQLSKPQSAITALLKSKLTIVIDDFHYLNPEIQRDLIRSLKQAVFDGLAVVLILIPHRMHQAATAEMDVDGRTQTLSIPPWQPDEQFSIADTGARALGVRFHAVTINEMVQESFQSPHLMQDFCSLLCSDNRVSMTVFGALKTLTFLNGSQEFFARLANTISPESFRALQKGPPRTNRIARPMRSGGSCDTYEAVLLAVKNLEVMTPIRWNELRRSLQDLLLEEPQQHEVTRVLEKMDDIAKSRPGEPVLDYVGGELHLVDPFFRFYVKWGDSAPRPLAGSTKDLALD